MKLVPFGEGRNGVEVRGAWGCAGGSKRLSKLVFRRLVSPLSPKRVMEWMERDERQVLVLRGRKHRIGSPTRIALTALALEDVLRRHVLWADSVQDTVVSTGGHGLMLPRSDKDHCSIEVFDQPNSTLGAEVIEDGEPHPRNVRAGTRGAWGI